MRKLSQKYTQNLRRFEESNTKAILDLIKKFNKNHNKLHKINKCHRENFYKPA